MHGDLCSALLLTPSDGRRFLAFPGALSLKGFLGMLLTGAVRCLVASHALFDWISSIWHITSGQSTVMILNSLLLIGCSIRPTEMLHCFLMPAFSK